jgi:histidyl-tRNA synthetase
MKVAVIAGDKELIQGAFNCVKILKSKGVNVNTFADKPYKNFYYDRQLNEAVKQNFDYALIIVMPNDIIKPNTVYIRKLPGREQHAYHIDRAIDRLIGLSKWEMPILNS